MLQAKKKTKVNLNRFRIVAYQISAMPGNCVTEMKHKSHKLVKHKSISKSHNSPTSFHIVWCVVR